ncbi:MAG: hypothetical protein JJE34_09490 [Alphaproteobacteria bacterium]|nr:hypothetical protein [Alphaproteobacteria bacterium]
MRLFIRLLSVLAPSLALAACAVPQSAPAPATSPVPSPPPATPPLSTEWRAWPVSPGDWVYRRDERGSLALFGVQGSAAALTIRCDKARGRIYVSRVGSVGANGGQMRLRTSFGDGVWTVRDTGGAPPYAAADVDLADPWLDRMAFSRGRFVVEVTGMPYLAIPAWPEFTRVIEDCRG